MRECDLPHWEDSWSLSCVSSLHSCDSCLMREMATRRSDRSFKCPLCARVGRDRAVVQAYMEEKTLDELICETDTSVRKEVMEV